MDTTNDRERSATPPIPDAGSDGGPGGEFLAALERATCPLIAAHVTPDTDAIGSVLGLAEALRQHGQRPVAVFTPATVATKLQFLFEMAPQVACRDDWQAVVGRDAVIVLDTASEARIRMQPPLTA